MNNKIFWHALNILLTIWPKHVKRLLWWTSEKDFVCNSRHASRANVNCRQNRVSSGCLSAPSFLPSLWLGCPVARPSPSSLSQLTRTHCAAIYNTAVAATHTVHTYNAYKTHIRVTRFIGRRAHGSWAHGLMAVAHCCAPVNCLFEVTSFSVVTQMNWIWLRKMYLN